jgi:DNA replication protein DnaC
MDESDEKPLGGAHSRRDITDKDCVRINLGKAYWKASVASMQDKEARQALIRYCEKLPEMATTGSGLIIDGPLGVGKTWAAAAVLKEAVRRKFPSYFVTHAELRELQFKDKIFGDGTDGMMVSQKLREAYFLVIDDLNEPFMVDKAFGPLHLERLVSYRNSRRLVTILTTRVAKQFKDQVSLFDIVSETMVPVCIEGENLRDIARQKLAARVFGE